MSGQGEEMENSIDDTLTIKNWCELGEGWTGCLACPAWCPADGRFPVLNFPVFRFFCGLIPLKSGTPTRDRSGQSSGLGSDGCFDERDHFSEGLTQGRVVLADFVEISAWGMLRPKLVGQTIREVLKHRKPLVQIHRLGCESAKIVDLAKFSPALNQVCLEKPPGSLLHQFGHSLGGDPPRDGANQRNANGSGQIGANPQDCLRWFSNELEPLLGNFGMERVSISNPTFPIVGSTHHDIKRKIGDRVAQMPDGPANAGGIGNGRI